MFYVEIVDRLIGQTVAYGDVYKTYRGAKKGLQKYVTLSRAEASKRGYGRVYTHWDSARTSCVLTHGKARDSHVWERVAIAETQYGIPVNSQILE